MTPKTLWKRDESDGKAESLGVGTGRVQPGSPKHDYSTQKLGTGTRGRQNLLRMEGPVLREMPRLFMKEGVGQA